MAEQLHQPLVLRCGGRAGRGSADLLDDLSHLRRAEGKGGDAEAFGQRGPLGDVRVVRGQEGRHGPQGHGAPGGGAGSQCRRRRGSGRARRGQDAVASQPDRLEAGSGPEPRRGPEEGRGGGGGGPAARPAEGRGAGHGGGSVHDGGGGGGGCCSEGYPLSKNHNTCCATTGMREGPEKGRKEGDCVSRRRRCTGGGGEGASTNEVGASTGTIDMSKTRRRMRPELLPIRLCAYFDYRSSNSCPYGAASCGSEKSSVGRKLVTTTKAHEPKVYRPGYQMANLVFILAHSKIISPAYLPSLLPIACWLLCMLLRKWYTSVVDIATE